MKCDFCPWHMSFNNIFAIQRHVDAHHPNLENYEIVWRDGEMCASEEVLTSDTELSFEIKNPFPSKILD